MTEATPWRRGHLAPPSSAPHEGERTDVVAAGAGWRVEHILTGHLEEPVDDLLDHVEWVVVLHGDAVLEIEGRHEELTAGSWIHIAPGVPHRVLEASPGTSWLAFHAEVPGETPPAERPQ